MAVLVVDFDVHAKAERVMADHATGHKKALGEQPVENDDFLPTSDDQNSPGSSRVDAAGQDVSVDI